MPQSLNSEFTYTEWCHQMGDGLKPLQESLDPLFQGTQMFRVYSSTLMPGLVQTEGYAAAVLRSVAQFSDLPFDDSAEAAQARVERSRVLHQPGHEFDLLIEESVLYHQIPNPEAMAAQLEALATAGALPAVSLGVLPLATREAGGRPHARGTCRSQTASARAGGSSGLVDGPGHALPRARGAADGRGREKGDCRPPGGGTAARAIGVGASRAGRGDGRAPAG
ncbi:Scr1 family TA system antitoxin-like transcriptional regulator [Streptomyces kronopolitis]|uniref:Scr1 family TA system antitoxin-like transcriptional regulator n=1 Tax=Streptomyces kronopolitis TaxID=1612435 RepID=UPI003D96B63D